MANRSGTKEHIANELVELLQQRLAQGPTEPWHSDAEVRLAYLYLAMNQLGEMVTITDLNHTITYANPAVEDILGYTPKEMIGHPSSEFFDGIPGNPPDLAKWIESEKEKKVWRGELFNRKKDGTIIKVHLSLNRLKDKSGKLIGCIAVAMDISDRKKAEEAIRKLLKKIERAKQEWEATADSLPDLVCLVVERGRIVRANRAIEYWGLGRVLNVMRRDVHELIHSGCADPSCYLIPFWKQAWKKVMQGQPSQCEIYDRLLKRYVLIQVQPLKDSGKELVSKSAIVTLRDISKSKKAEAELTKYSEHLEEMVEERTRELRDAQERMMRQEKLAVLGKLAGGMAHELRNPLGAVKNAAYFLKMVLEDPAPEVREALDILNTGVITSDRIIRSLLDFARPKIINRRMVDINKVTRESLPNDSTPKNIEVVFQPDETLPHIPVDPEQIAQVFSNIILNAVQAMPGGGRLTITSRALDQDWVTVSFADTGMGIPGENLGNIFEPLFSTKAKGIGLGLPICSALVCAHGGGIAAESEAGKGSIFTVRLPTARKEKRQHG